MIIFGGSTMMGGGGPSMPPRPIGFHMTGGCNVMNKTNGGKSPLATAKDYKPREMGGEMGGGDRSAPVGSVQKQASNIKADSGGDANMNAGVNFSDGTYQPWQSEKLEKSKISSITAGWVGSSSNVRHAIQGVPDKYSSVSVIDAQKYDDWVCSGSHSGVLYRGVHESGEKYEALMALKPGQMVDQNGPSSFSTSESVAQNFASGGFSPGDKRVVYVLEQGSNCCQSIKHMSGLNEHEVIVGSASNLVVTKAPETKIIDGKHYTYIYGYEMKSQFVPSGSAH